MSVLRSLAGAFYSRALYREVAAGWTPLQAIALLALALAIGWAITVVSMQHAATGWAERDAMGFIDALPPLELRDGRLFADPPGPHVYRLGEDAAGPVVVTLDTTGGTTSVDERGLLVTDTQIMMRRNAVETRSFDIRSAAETAGRGDGPIEKDTMRTLVRAVTQWGPVALFPFAWLAELVDRLAHAALLALIGLGLARVLGAGLSFGPLYALALVVLVP